MTPTRCPRRSRFDRSATATEDGVLSIFVTTGLTAANEKRVRASLDPRRCRLKVTRVDTARLEGLRVDGHLSLDTYSRLLIPLYLKGFRKVLYLDADVVVRHSIGDIWRRSVGGVCLLAVPGAGKGSVFGARFGVPSYRALGIPGQTRTFNAGVLLLNLDEWRRSRVSSEILDYLRAFRRLSFGMIRMV